MFGRRIGSPWWYVETRHLFCKRYVCVCNKDYFLLLLKEIHEGW